MHSFSQAALSALFCADIKTAPGNNPGLIFAMYMTSGEPVDRNKDKWDELDVELLGKSPSSMWINYFHNGMAETAGTNKPFSPAFAANSGFHEYCLDWTAGGTAKWLVDGEQFHTMALTGWSKPMFPVASMWARNHPWSGQILRTETLYSTMQNWRYIVRG